MALGATIYKAQLCIADMDRHYYADHDLTIAQHPSETDIRMMVRIAAFALNADAQLTFCKGISTEDEPDLWQKSYGGDIERWIDLGQPDEKRIKKACGRAEEVIIYTYHAGSARPWWQQMQNKLERFKNLRVIHLEFEGIDKLVARTMSLQCNIQDGQLTLHDSEDQTVTVTQELWKA